MNDHLSKLHESFAEQVHWQSGVGGSENRMEYLNTKFQSKLSKVTKRWGTRNPRKSVLASKVVNTFTCALGPPFIRRWRDFYIPRLPSNIENIRSVNMYMNVFYIPWFAGLISYIYKPASSSHFKPGLFEMTSLTWSSIDFRNLAYWWRSLLIETYELRFLKLPEVRRFVTSRICRIPVVLKQIVDLRSKVNSVIISHDVRR
jgi:hypothetical protein